jgi:uroporphyrinogen III methyltransferase/synthase
MTSPAVWLIGAGPGDPGLITVRGLACLQQADVVIHDHQVSSRMLEHARGAELIDVGTAAPDSLEQQAISILLMEKVREGKRVARLKWGDPFVFGRGGEEALFLHEQGIPFEVVPGVPAAVAVPAYAGIPLAYPGGGDTITFVRGYEDEKGTLPRIDWASLAKLEGTVVCYAGPQQLPRILEAMAAHGWHPETSAAVVYNGTTPTQNTITGTIPDLLRQVRAQHTRGPAILLAGRVLGFRDHLRWFDSRPLFGRRILVTRPREQAAELSDRLAALGADAIEAPMITIAPPEDMGPLIRAAAEPDNFDWIVFTSVNAVDTFMAALVDGDRDVRALKGPLLCAIGSATAGRLARHGIKADLLPPEFRAEAVVAALAGRVTLDGARVLLPRSDIGREIIGEQLRDAGAVVTEVIAYRTILEDAPRPGEPDIYGMLLQGHIDVVTFTSASAVRNFARVYGAEQAVDLLKNTVVAAIGPVTAETAVQLGFTVTVQPATYTVPAMVEAIAAHFQTGPLATT